MVAELRHCLIKKINQVRCNIISRKQSTHSLPLSVGYLTIFHDFEAHYAVPGSAAASHKGITNILDIEKKYNVKATYSIVARLIEDYPQVVLRIISNGHELASHSYEHKIMANLSTREVRIDVMKTKMLFDSIGVRLTGFRSPESKWTFRQMHVLLEEGLSWSAEADNAKFPYILLQNEHSQLVRMPILMDDWEYKSEQSPPETMLRNLLNNVDNIAQKRVYGAIGFHPWVQGEDEQRLEVFEKFINIISNRNDLRILTFGEMHNLFMKFQTV